MSNTATTILRAARDLIADPADWRQGERDDAGPPRCAMHALADASRRAEDYLGLAYSEAIIRLATALGADHEDWPMPAAEAVFAANDAGAPAVAHAAMMEAFEAAILAGPAS